MKKMYLHLSASNVIPEGQIHIMSSFVDSVPIIEIVAKIVSGEPEKYELVIYPAEKSRLTNES